MRSAFFGRVARRIANWIVDAIVSAPIFMVVGVLVGAIIEKDDLDWLKVVREHVNSAVDNFDRGSSLRGGGSRLGFSMS